MQFEQSLRFWHQMFANASADPLYLPGGERHILRKVFGSQFVISSAEESAGIQAVDLVLWLFQRVLSGNDLPPASARLMRFVFRRARQHDFSFAGVSNRLEVMFDGLWSRPLSEAQLAKALSYLINSNGSGRKT
jgi:hypothetical protein